MDIDLTLLHSKTEEEISITGIYNIPDEYIDKDLVVSANNINVDGYVYLDEEDNDKIKCSIKGNIEIEDSVSLDKLDYPISIEYDDIIEENCKKVKIYLIYSHFCGKILY